MKEFNRELAEAVCHSAHGIPAEDIRFFDQDGRGRFVQEIGRGAGNADELRYALQEAVDKGGVYIHEQPEGLQWVVALEHMRVVQGGMCCVPKNGTEHTALLDNGHCWYQSFYQISGWNPLLLQERRTEWKRREQQAEANCDPAAMAAMHSFQKERKLLSLIRAGDRQGARRVLNETLAAIYLSAPSYPVLRARVIELVCSLTRAAIEDNPLLASLTLRNQEWMEQFVQAESFETLSRSLMQALDAFIRAVHLHGTNRTNTHVHKALDYISQHYHAPISLQAVARHTGLSACRLAHLFRSHTGKTVVEMIRQVRLRHAREMLRQTDHTCAEIAYACGFNDQSYFHLHFKRQSGQTPLQYRRAVT